MAAVRVNLQTGSKCRQPSWGQPLAKVNGPRKIQNSNEESCLSLAHLVCQLPNNREKEEQKDFQGFGYAFHLKEDYLSWWNRMMEQQLL
ncbi:hypothetical protein DUI87_16206 [Hirundo rustica rustica]|uniref:Uncharacterized protein n=1 Tax=Hirundo rustica rustica TaxID=333673 RepID=A0A3M0K6S1_HIRRU|nr:hypothetical protein DUI87_16206 [Hirundo rustica rustica]